VAHSIGGATPCDTWGSEQSTVRQPVYLMGAPPRNTEPKHAPATVVATKSANRRLMRGTLLQTEATTHAGRIRRRREGLTRPTYS
jgi:hypothetical protein